MKTEWSNEAIRFYCGLGEKHYNHHPVVTGPYACVAPVSGSKVKKVNSVAVPEGVSVLQDSGAFNDACLLLRGQERHISQMKQCRVSFKEALQRQERHAEHFGYSHQIEARASYDVLIDETWTEDASGLLVRCKKRWSETDAELAVEETVAVAAFPASTSYETYLEPCGGAAHVLMCKPQWGHREIYNDLNDDLYNFWCQMQQNADLLAHRLQALPYSRALYYTYHARLFNGSTIDPLERAVMWFYVLRSTGTGWIRESPVGWNNTASNAAAFRSVLEWFDLIQERLTHPQVILDNRDVGRVIEEYDTPSTLHYIDPPYIGAEYYYQAGIRNKVKKTFDHKRLAEILNTVKGYAALSYYPHPDLDRWYPLDRWQRMIWQQPKSSTITTEVQFATEMLLCNYSAPVPTIVPMSLWDAEGGTQ